MAICVLTNTGLNITQRPVAIKTADSSALNDDRNECEVQTEHRHGSQLIYIIPDC